MTPTRRASGVQARARTTRDKLLAAGLSVAAEGGLGAASADAVTVRAGVAKGTYYFHFQSRTEFLLELTRHWHADLMSDVRAATRDLPPGSGRITAAATAYLDACLTRPAVKALLIDSRSDQALAPGALERNQTAADLFTVDFAHIGLTPAPQAAHLYIAMVNETALREHLQGGRDPALRDALVSFARSPG